MTRSRMRGNARIGSTVIGSSGSKSDSRVLHVRLGRPLTSALHEPHFAALQFQRTARSGAAWAWIQWRASRTTIPSSTGTSNSANVPGSLGVPRKIRIRMFGIRLLRRLRPGCAGPSAWPGSSTS